MSSHQCRGRDEHSGKRAPRRRAGSRAPRRRCRGARSGRRRRGSTQMPKASHAQFPYHERPPASTRYGVGTAENGFAIRISSPSRTSACASCSRRQPASTLVAWAELLGADGARPRRTNSAYVRLRQVEIDHGSVWTMISATPGSVAADALLDLARARVRLGERQRRSRARPSGRRRAPRRSRGSGARAAARRSCSCDDARHRLRVGAPPRDAAPLRLLRQRLEMRPHRVDAGQRLLDRAARPRSRPGAPPRATSRPAASGAARPRCGRRRAAR